MIDWKRKLTSRKFWCALIGFVTPLLIAFGIPQETAAQVAAIIMAGGTLIAYIIGEGLVDAANTELVITGDDDDGNVHVIVTGEESNGDIQGDEI